MKLLLIGAGIRTPLLLHGLVRRQERLGLREVVIFDDDPDRLGTMGAFARYVAERAGATFTVRAEPDFATAARGASFVFSAIRVGKESQRIADERIPLRHGVLGQETTGPGGLAMALRTVPALLRYAAVLAREAPDAWFVNFTNPAGLITQALVNQTSLRVIGICDTPTSMRTSIARVLERDEDDLFFEYAGLNHLGWVRRVLVDGRDRLPDLIERYEDLRTADHQWGLFDAGLVRLLGLLPNEYLYYYYYREQAVEHILASGSTRGEQILGINEPLWRELTDQLAAGRPDLALAAYERRMFARSSTYMDRESGRPSSPSSPSSPLDDEGYAGLALAVMEAVVGRRPATLVLNVVNGGCLPDLPPDDVVEVTCLVDERGPRPLAQLPLPERVRSLVLSVKSYERLAVEAAVTGSVEAAVAALTVHPLVCSYSLATRIVADYLDAHRDFLPQFASRAGSR
jgi:6-phospho-beta-glucosidase